MRTGDLARRSGVNLQTVRYYERRGLLPDPRRGQSGYRDYDDAAVDRLLFVKEAQALGFTLREVAELLQLRESPSAGAAEVRARAREKLEQVRHKLQGLRRLERALVRLLAGCRGSGPARACSILEQLERKAVADLVRGSTSTKKQARR